MVSDDHIFSIFFYLYQGLLGLFLIDVYGWGALGLGEHGSNKMVGWFGIQVVGLVQFRMQC